MADHLVVGLSSWIVQEGNYGDFARGDRAAFAVEFYAARAWREIAPLAAPALVHSWGAFHAASGRIVHLDDEWWAIDAGTVMFRKERPPPHARLGLWVQADISLSIDPHFYCDMLAHKADALALVHDWRIEKIEIQTAPLLRSIGVRESAKLGWREIAKTEVWEDDEGHADYILHCRRQDGPARRTLEP